MIHNLGHLTMFNPKLVCLWACPSFGFFVRACSSYIVACSFFILFILYIGSRDKCHTSAFNALIIFWIEINSEIKMDILTEFYPFPNKPWFLPVCITSLLKKLREKEKLLVMSNFPFSTVFSNLLHNFQPCLSIWNCRLQTLSVIWERFRP